jgi:methyl-accepting chemotaxis protein
MICTICSVNLVYNQKTHELYCPKCGLVYATIYYTFKRNFLEDHSLYIDTTEIYVKKDEENKDLLKLKEINRKVDRSKVRSKLAKLYNYASDLGIIVDHKILDYYKALKKSNVKTRYLSLFSVILYALDKGIKIDENKIIETIKKHRLSKRRFNKILRKILKEFNIRNDLDYTKILQEYLREFPELNGYLNEIIDTLEKIKESLKDISKSLTTKTVVSLAIYHVAKHHNLKIDYLVSRTTLRSNYLLIENYLKEENK